MVVTTTDGAVFDVAAAEDAEDVAERFAALSAGRLPQARVVAVVKPSINLM